MSPRTKCPTGVTSYYSALQETFKLQSRILTGAVPHYGERGRNDEERVREFLRRMLPKRFGVGSGFVACSEPSTALSRQTDIVIFDQLLNCSLFHEPGSNVYPIEIVYATIEVKGCLEKKDIPKTLDSIAEIRRMAAQKTYVRWVNKETRPGSGHYVVQPEPFNEPLPPRSYVFAYAKKGWPKLLPGAVFI
jgi:hypothetical protein